MEGFDLSFELFYCELIVIALIISGAPRALPKLSLSGSAKGALSPTMACDDEDSLCA